VTGSSSSEEKVIIVGGAVVGSFVAYFLQEMGFGGQIQIVERDPTYRFSSTALSAASIRTQFGCRVNVRMSLFGAEFFRNIKDRFGPDADIGFHENGYLILGAPTDAEARTASLAMQRAEGAEILALDSDQLLARFPWLNVEDVGLGTFGARNEGWFDAWSLLSLIRSRVRSRGGEYILRKSSRFSSPAGASGASNSRTGELSAPTVASLPRGLSRGGSCGIWG